MKKLSILTLIFAILSFALFILLVFLRIPFHLYPTMSYQDAIDILTPLFLIPIYWIFFRDAASKRSSLSEPLPVAYWVFGAGCTLDLPGMAPTRR